MYYVFPIMTIQQTVDIPASRRLTIEVPREIPMGRVMLAFTPVPAGDETPAGNEAAILAEEARIRELSGKYPVHVCSTLAEAETAMASQNTPKGREAFKQMLKRTHGAFKDGKAWGKGVDVDAKIRALRDEWDSGNDQISLCAGFLCYYQAP
jgi:hypothetical protein